MSYLHYENVKIWKEHIFWTVGYFVYSVGNISEEMPRKYIDQYGLMKKEEYDDKSIDDSEGTKQSR